MSVTIAALCMREKTLWDDQMQMILGSSHGDIEQAAFFLDLCSHRSQRLSIAIGWAIHAQAQS